MFQTLQNKLTQLPSELAYRAARIKHANQLPELRQDEQLMMKTLEHDGVVVTCLEDLGFHSTPTLIAAASNLLTSVAGQSQERLGTTQGITVRPAKFTTLTNCPDFFLWGLEERLLNMIESYVKLPIAYHGVNLRYDLPVDKPGATQLWHRDGEDRRIFKVIIYLTDVASHNGPFEYIPKSLTPSLASFGHIYRKILKSGFSGISDEEMSQVIPESAWKACLGSAGTVIFVDTRSVFHRGRPPKEKRAALFYLYTSRNPVRPDICKANLECDRVQLAALANTLSQQQKRCVLWESNHDE